MKRLLPTLVLIAVVLGGAVLRLDFARHAVVLGGDQNTQPLMALHIMQGRDFPLYFYGQHYMGGIGPYVIAVTFRLLGPSDGAFSVAMVLFSVLWIYASFLLFRRLVGAWAGVIAAMVVAFAPAGLIRESVVRTGYISTFAYGTLILWLGVRLNDGDCSPRAEWGCVLGMGALAGLAIWTNPLCAPYLIVGLGLLAAYVVRRRFGRSVGAKLAAGLGLFLVTVSPAIVTGLRYGLGALFGFRASRLEYVPQVVAISVNRYIPDLLRPSPAAAGLVQWVIGCAYGLPLAALVAGLFVGALRRDRRLVRAALVPILFVAAFLPFYLTNPLAKEYNPRYFLMFWLLLVASFAFPLVFRRRWVSWGGVTLAAIVVVANAVACVSAGRGAPGRAVAACRAAREELVEAAATAGLRHVMNDTIEAHVLNWAGRERVIFASPSDERYYPYVAKAIADDDAGFCRLRSEAHVFEETLRCVGVRSSKKVSAGDWTIFYGLVLPTTTLEAVRPAEATLVRTMGETADATGLIDQDDETIVGDRYEAGTGLMVSFDEAVALAAIRFVAPKEWDYPSGYTISGSTDGTEWFELQRVGRRLANARIHGHRLFHRGEFGAMECRFPTKTVRFVRLDGLRAPAAQCPVWRFQEIYFYGEAGEQARPDEEEAAAMATRLEEAGVTFAFCDPWLSRKIELLGERRPDVLPYFSERHRPSRVSRVVPIRRSVAVVVENGHAEDAKRLMLEATLGEARIETRRTANYTALVITDAPAGSESFPGLRWNGFAPARTARMATAGWYHEQGVRLERAGHADEATRYFQRSFETYDGILENLRKLSSTSKAAREVLEKLTPEVEARCQFPYGMSLVGYRLRPSPLVAGEKATLSLVWELEGEIPYDYVPLFVHFVGDEGIRFQADHDVRFRLTPRTAVPRCLVLDEFVWEVPSDCPSGELSIRFGALVWWDRDRRLKPRTRLPHEDRAVELGTVTVYQEGSAF